MIGLDNDLQPVQVEIQMKVSYPIVDMAHSFSEAISHFVNAIFPIAILTLICAAYLLSQRM
jgi:hypothetical protein